VPGLLLAAALVGLGCIAYLNSLEVPFVFDDLNTVQLNNAVLFPNFSLQRPVTYLYPRALLYASFTVNYRFGGEHVLGYHVINIFLHILNALLVFAIGTRVLKAAGV